MAQVISSGIYGIKIGLDELSLPLNLGIIILSA
jgi:hypothetical protein